MVTVARDDFEAVKENKWLGVKRIERVSANSKICKKAFIATKLADPRVI